MFMTATRWDFYGRGNELGGLLEKMRRDRWFFGAIQGRRRIGKTALVQQALKTLAEDEANARQALLFQLPDSTAADLAAAFRNAVREAGFGGRGEDRIRDLPGVAAAVGSLCAEGTIVALDEFQLCRRGPLSALPSLLQAQVDRLQDQDTAGGLIVLGSVQTEMEALLEDRKAPLFGRTTFRISLGPWELRTIFEICGERGAGDPARCLTLWTLFGGIPKYWRHFAEADGLDAVPDWTDWTTELCSRLFLRSEAPLRDEGEVLMGRELRRTYLAILRTVAERRVCSQTELKEALPDQTSLGPYLKILTKDLRLIGKELPVFADDSSRGARYVVSDPFLCAWLAALQPASQAARIFPAAEVAPRLLPRLRSLEGHAFERMVRDVTEEASRASSGDFPLTDRVRGYWNRPRSVPKAVEIDLVAWNDDDRRVRFGSCKRNQDQHDAGSLRDFRGHVDRFLATAAGRRFRNWRQEFALFSPRFSEERRANLEAEGWVCRDLDDFRRLLLEDGRGPRGAGGIAEGRRKRTMAQALPANRTAEFRLIVENGNWGAASLAAIRAVLASAADVLSEAFGTPPDAPVRVGRWDLEPRAFPGARPYEIRINAQGFYWCQYIHQFSRELCRAMTGFDRFESHRHKWFEESLCELASLFVLHRLEKVWTTEPPVQVYGASGFAPNHAAYAEGLEEKYRIPPGIALPEWLAMNIGALEANPSRRDLNGSVAVALLDNFLRDPTLWRDCLALNRWDPGTDATFSDYLESWTVSLRECGSEARVPTLARETFRPDLPACIPRNRARHQPFADASREPSPGSGRSVRGSA